MGNERPDNGDVKIPYDASGVKLALLSFLSFQFTSSTLLYAAAADTVSISTFGSGADLPPRSVARALGFLV